MVVVPKVAVLWSNTTLPPPVAAPSPISPAGRVDAAGRARYASKGDGLLKT